MFYVLFDHNMMWPDGYTDRDKHVAGFHSSDDAFAFAAFYADREIVSDECTDWWSVRRVMHDDDTIDYPTDVVGRYVTPDCADELAASDFMCDIIPR